MWIVRDGFGRRDASVAGSGRESVLLQGHDRHIQQVRIVVDEDVLHGLGLRPVSDHPVPRGRVVLPHLVLIRLIGQYCYQLELV